MKIEIMIEGVTEVVGQLNKYYGSVVDETSDHIKLYTGKVQRTARSHVNSRTNRKNRHGDLRKSITKSYNRSKLVGVVRTRSKDGWYAHMVEYGTKPHWMKKRKWMHPGAKPAPFMKPAWDKHKHQFLGGLRQILRRKKWRI